MDTKEKIIEALDEDGISGVGKAIEYLESLDMEVLENPNKWEVEDNNGNVFRFRDDYELIEWAREERDKIEEI